VLIFVPKIAFAISAKGMDETEQIELIQECIQSSVAACQPKSTTELNGPCMPFEEDCGVQEDSDGHGHGDDDDDDSSEDVELNFNNITSQSEVEHEQEDAILDASCAFAQLHPPAGDCTEIEMARLPQTSVEGITTISPRDCGIEKNVCSSTGSPDRTPRVERAPEPPCTDLRSNNSLQKERYTNTASDPTGLAATPGAVAVAGPGFGQEAPRTKPDHSLADSTLKMRYGAAMLAIGVEEFDTEDCPPPNRQCNKSVPANSRKDANGMGPTDDAALKRRYQAAMYVINPEPPTSSGASQLHRAGPEDAAKVAASDGGTIGEDYCEHATAETASKTDLTQALAPLPSPSCNASSQPHEIHVVAVGFHPISSRPHKLMRCRHRQLKSKYGLRHNSRSIKKVLLLTLCLSWCEFPQHDYKNTGSCRFLCVEASITPARTTSSSSVPWHPETALSQKEWGNLGEYQKKPPYVFAPQGRLYSVDHVMEAVSSPEDPTSNLVVAINCRDGVVVVSTVNAPANAAMVLLPETDQSNTTTHTDLATTASTTLFLNQDDTKSCTPPSTHVVPISFPENNNVFAVTAGNAVHSQILRRKIESLADSMYIENDDGTTSTKVFAASPALVARKRRTMKSPSVAILARRLADLCQKPTQCGGKPGRMLVVRPDQLWVFE